MHHPRLGLVFYAALYNIIMKLIVTVAQQRRRRQWRRRRSRTPRKDTKEPPYCEGGRRTDSEARISYNVAALSSLS